MLLSVHDMNSTKTFLSLHLSNILHLPSHLFLPIYAHNSLISPEPEQNTTQEPIETQSALKWKNKNSSAITFNSIVVRQTVTNHVAAVGWRLHSCRIICMHFHRVHLSDVRPVPVSAHGLCRGLCLANGNGLRFRPDSRRRHLRLWLLCQVCRWSR